MKTILLALALYIGACLTSCTRENTIDLTQIYPVEFKGLIIKQGITSYMYGTHTITGNNKTYALKSSTVNLNDYVDKTVTIKGSKIDGYPVDGGPDYIDVKVVE